MRLRRHGCLPLWSGDDPGRGKCSDLDCDRRYRHSPCATINAAIFDLPRYRILIRIVARISSSLSRYSVPTSLSTLADQVGGCTAALMPLLERLKAYALSAKRLHGDDTTVPVLTKGKTNTGRIWVYVRDDEPFVGPAPSGAVFITRAIGPASNPRRIWPTTPGHSRLTPMMAIANFTMAAARPA
jgi:hypothetical protein